MDVDPVIEPHGECALIVRLGDAIDAAVNDRVIAIAESLLGDPLPGQRDVVTAFASLAVRFDPCALEDSPGGVARFESLLRARCAAVGPLDRATRLLEIPVCYDRSVAPDIEAVAAHAGLTVDEVAAIHAAGEYRVFMVGFTPGFPYLGGLDERLAMPRRATPRETVPAGSVAIGGSQTGIYPDASPGGWWIIGRTSLRLFDPAADPPALATAGDRVRFRAIAPDELARTS